MTPETAQALEPGTTPGPWEWREHKHTPYNVEGPDQDYESLGTADSHALHTQDGECYASWFVASDEDKALIAAAPDMRATIAAQTCEYGVSHRGTVICLDFYGTEDEEPGHNRWTDSRAHAEKWKAYMEEAFPGESYRLVHRPVGPVEVVE